MQEYLPYIQIATAIVLMALILLQQKGQALGSTFGQSGTFYSTKRGIQKKIFWASVFVGAFFIVLAISNLILK